MPSKLILPNGARYGYGSNNERICIGSQMGRQDILPDDTTEPIKLHCERLKFVDGDYDAGGAYWGGGGLPLYCAWKEKWSAVSIMANYDAMIFVRARCRAEAKQKVRAMLPNARFFH